MPEDFSSLEQSMRKLPALPQAVTEVLTAMDRGEIEIAQISRKIQQDPTLTLRILGVANSPFYGFSGHINAIKDACVLLGIPTIRSLVISSGVVLSLSCRGPMPFDCPALWKHALGVGVAARILAKPLKLDGELAFTAGLLHDIGKLALPICFQQHCEAIATYLQQNRCLPREAECAILGFDHARIGAKIAEYWHLPAEITTAIAMHHDPDAESASTLACLIHVADVLCRALAIGNGGGHGVPPMSATAMHKLKLDWDTLERHLPEIEPRCEDAMSMLTI